MTKNAPRNMALLSVIGNLVLLGTGFDFMYSLQHDKRWTWLQIVAAAIIVSSQALIHYRREQLMQKQHDLITREVTRIAHEEQQIRNPHEGRPVLLPHGKKPDHGGPEPQ